MLILSEFAGAAQSLGAGAILVNPWNINDMAAAIKAALTMRCGSHCAGWPSGLGTEHQRAAPGGGVALPMTLIQAEAQVGGWSPSNMDFASESAGDQPEHGSCAGPQMGTADYQPDKSSRCQV